VAALREDATVAAVVQKALKRWEKEEVAVQRSRQKNGSNNKTVQDHHLQCHLTLKTVEVAPQDDGARTDAGEGEQEGVTDDMEAKHSKKRNTTINAYQSSDAHQAVQQDNAMSEEGQGEAATPQQLEGSSRGARDDIEAGEVSPSAHRLPAWAEAFSHCEAEEESSERNRTNEGEITPWQAQKYGNDEEDDNERLGLKELRRIIDCMDYDSDGKVRYYELLRMLRRKSQTVESEQPHAILTTLSPHVIMVQPSQHKALTEDMEDRPYITAGNENGDSSLSDSSPELCVLHGTGLPEKYQQDFAQLQAVYEDLCHRPCCAVEAPHHDSCRKSDKSMEPGCQSAQCEYDSEAMSEENVSAATIDLSSHRIFLNPDGEYSEEPLWSLARSRSLLALSLSPAHHTPGCSFPSSLSPHGRSLSATSGSPPYSPGPSSSPPPTKHVDLVSSATTPPILPWDSLPTLGRHSVSPSELVGTDCLALQIGEACPLSRSPSLPPATSHGTCEEQSSDLQATLLAALPKGLIDMDGLQAAISEEPKQTNSQLECLEGVLGPHLACKPYLSNSVEQ